MKHLFFISLIFINIFSCKKLSTEPNNKQKEENKPKKKSDTRRSLILDKIKIPNSFNFETHQLVNFEIHTTSSSSFIIYALDPNRENSELLAKFSSKNGTYKLSKRVNKNIKEFLIIRTSSRETTYRYEKPNSSRVLVYY